MHFEVDGGQRQIQVLMAKSENQPETLGTRRHSQGSLNEESSADYVNLMSPNQKQEVDEVRRLKLQNGLLILDRITNSKS